MIAPDLLADIGAVLYGLQWKSDLARVLGVTDSTVRRWASGRKSMPRARWEQLLEVMMARSEMLAELCELVQRELETNA